MCGVIGYYSEKPNKEDKNLISNLIYQSKIRGLHSFGITYRSEASEYITEKKFKVEDIELPNTNMLIGHNRYSTSGNWKKNINNQPIELNDNYLVFNGVIDMASKKEMENKHKIRMNTDNDGEIFLHYLKKIDPVEILKNLKCSFAGLFIKNKEIYCIRNKHRPLWRVVINKSVFIASTQDIFKRSGCEDAAPIQKNKLIKLKELIDTKKGIQKLSYPDDGNWGYRSSVFLPTLHSK